MTDLSKMSKEELVRAHNAQVIFFTLNDVPESIINMTQTELLSRLKSGGEAIGILKECDDYLESLYKRNTIGTGSILHQKIKAILKRENKTTAG